MKWALGWGQFWPKSHDLLDFDRGPLDDITTQISKP